MEAKKYYIAYGSNLSRQQMAQRCPGSKDHRAVLC